VPGNMHTCEKSRLHDPHVKALSMPVAAGMRLSLIEYRIDSGDTPEMAVEAISGSFFFQLVYPEIPLLFLLQRLRVGGKTRASRISFPRLTIRRPS